MGSNTQTHLHQQKGCDRTVEMVSSRASSSSRSSSSSLDDDEHDDVVAAAAASFRSWSTSSMPTMVMSPSIVAGDHRLRSSF